MECGLRNKERCTYWVRQAKRANKIQKQYRPRTLLVFYQYFGARGNLALHHPQSQEEEEEKQKQKEEKRAFAHYFVIYK